MTHKRLSPSSSARWLNCPGCINLEDKLIQDGVLKTERKSSVYADEGTAAHDLLNRCLNDMIRGGWRISAERYGDFRLSVSPDSGLVTWLEKGEYPIPGESLFPINDDMIWAVDQAIYAVRKILEDDYGANENGIPADVTVELEVRGTLACFGREDLGGTVDIRISQLLGKTTVIDYKHGRGIPVDPTRNTQLMTYAAVDGIAAHPGDDPVELVIVQPRCAKNETVSTWSTTAAELLQWVQTELIPGANATEVEDAPLVTGEHCEHFCPCAAHCPALHENAVAVAETEFGDLDAKALTDDKIRAIAATLDPIRLAEMLNQAPLFRAILNAVEEAATQAALSGAEIPGYKLIAGTSRRKWVEDAEAKLKSKRVPKKVTHEQKLISFSKLEKLEGGKYKEIVNELTEKPEATPKLVPASHKAPAIAAPATAEFVDLTDDIFN